MSLLLSIIQMTMSFLRRYWTLFLLLLLSLFSILPFFQTGFFPVHDDTQVARVFEMGKALKDGMFPVRWVSDLGYGYGYPIFNFYSPFPYYLGGVLILMGFNALLATKITFIIAILLSGLFMYLFTKNFLNDFAALVAGLIYLYFPYHAVNIYVRGDLGEVFAYAFLPLVFLGFYKIFYSIQKNDQIKNNLQWIIFSAISIALVIISHNLTSYMLFIVLILFMLVSFIFSRNKFKFVLFCFLAMLLGFSLSAFYSIPALLEMRYTNVLSQIGGGARYSDHFVCLPQFWSSFWGYGGSTVGCVDGMSFKLGKINIILAVFSIVLFLYISIKNKFKGNIFLHLSVLFLLFFSIFMTLEASLFMWKSIPSMEFLQYPWRFLNFVGFFLSVTIALLVVEFNYLFKTKLALILIAIIIFFTIFYNAKLFQPKTFSSGDVNFYTDISYLKWTVSKISDEYMPANFKKPNNKKEIPNQIFEINGKNGKISKIYAKTNDMKALVNLNKKSSLKINIAYFPAWNIYIDGQKINPQVTNQGFSVLLTQGEHIIWVKFKQTKVEIIANIISLIGFIIIILAIIYGRKIKNI